MRSPSEQSDRRRQPIRGHCVTRGALLDVDDGENFDLAVHDCEEDEWLLVSLNIPHGGRVQKEP